MKVATKVCLRGTVVLVLYKGVYSFSCRRYIICQSIPVDCNVIYFFVLFLMVGENARMGQVSVLHAFGLLIFIMFCLTVVSNILLFF